MSLNLKSDFPILSQIINEKPITYLDSGATSQKPQVVIDSLKNYYETFNANIHRGVYKFSEQSTAAVDDTRDKVANFINAKSPKEIVFTRNATESINLVAATWARENLSEGDEIVTTQMEHHSNFVPWQVLVKKSSCKLRIVDITEDGLLDIEDFENSLNENTKLVSIVHVSNVLGTINPVKELIKTVRAKAPNALVLIDACQSVPHMKVDVQDMDADFLVFSSHKMLGPTGIGVLYGKQEILEEMPPYMTGGDMISEVHNTISKWAELPQKFEAGTPHIAGIIGLGAAIEYLGNIGMDKVEEHEKEITKYAYQELSKVEGLTIVGPKNLKLRSGIIAFTLENIHPHDIAQILDEDNVCIRAGHHCAQPLHERLDINSSARCSFYIYNDEVDVDRLIEGLLKVQETFK